MSYTIGIYEHRAHLFAGLPGRDPRFAELDRLIAEEKHIFNRVHPDESFPTWKRPDLMYPGMGFTRPYSQNGWKQREAHRKAWETRRKRYGSKGVSGPALGGV